MANKETKMDKTQLYTGIIWIVSSIALASYWIMIFLDTSVPGIGDLVKFLSSIDDKYIYLVALISIFIEGLYFIGVFFPGGSIVLITTVISGVNGYGVFLTTLFLIFIGWSFAGALNIYIAKTYRNKILKLSHSDEYDINDRIWTTWFPAFRSSYEVAQVFAGGHPIKVYISSLKVRFWATFILGGVALIVPLMLDIHELSDNESLLTIFIIFCISFTMGIIKIKKYFGNKMSPKAANKSL